MPELNITEVQRIADAVIATISEGGDTDTNAAIVGALFGAVDGRNAIPNHWRQKVLSCWSLRTEGARQPKPLAYWRDDVTEPAEDLPEAGAAHA